MSCCQRRVARRPARFHRDGCTASGNDVTVWAVDRGLLIRRLNLENHSIRRRAATRAFSRNVDVTVRTLLHVADANAERNEQSFATLRLRRLTKRDSNELFGRERTDEQ